MAEAAGLKLSDHKLIPAKKGPGYFATRRFDRPSADKRLHMLSLAGAIEALSHIPSSYDALFRATCAITRNAEDVEHAFRRMLFSVLAHNRNDHTRQHAFLMDAAGEWRLAPASDFTYAAGPGCERYLDIEGEGKTRRETKSKRLAPGMGSAQKTSPPLLITLGPRSAIGTDTLAPPALVLLTENALAAPISGSRRPFD